MPPPINQKPTTENSTSITNKERSLKNTNPATTTTTTSTQTDILALINLNICLQPRFRTETIFPTSITIPLSTSISPSPTFPARCKTSTIVTLGGGALCLQQQPKEVKIRVMEAQFSLY